MPVVAFVVFLLAVLFGGWAFVFSLPFGFFWFLANYCFLVVSSFCCIPAWLKSVMPEEQTFEQPVQLPLLSPGKNTIYFIRSQMKCDRLCTSVQSHVLGLKFRAEHCSLTAITPHPARVQIPSTFWGAVPWGLGPLWGQTRLIPPSPPRSRAGRPMKVGMQAGHESP